MGFGALGVCAPTPAPGTLGRAPPPPPLAPWCVRPTPPLAPWGSQHTAWAPSHTLHHLLPDGSFAEENSGSWWSKLQSMSKSMSKHVTASCHRPERTRRSSPRDSCQRGANQGALTQGGALLCMLQGHSIISCAKTAQHSGGLWQASPAQLF